MPATIRIADGFRLLIGAVCLFLVLGLSAAERPNVLFIAVDDLRPEIRSFGVERMHTPNLDRLASRGTIFQRAYCMVPTCGASRASLMTGLRPARDRFVSYRTWAERDAKGITTLNTQFRKNGYYTVSNGKVFHNKDDNKQGWSEPAWRPALSGLAYNRPENIKINEERSKQKGRRRGPAYESAEVPDDAYADGQIAAKGVADLRRLAQRDEPFFLAVGFMKPHLPFNCPKKYWDLYPAESIHLPATYHRPKNAPDAAIHSSGELRAYAGIPSKGPVSDETALNLIRGYYACVSYTDAQVGKVLDELDRLGLAESTIVVLWGDHGWNLAEHTLWCKHSCFETSMRAPLIVSAPGHRGGQVTRGLTEFIDIYPSLCELAGVPKPDHLQGRSFVPLLKDPDRDWKPFAIGRFGPGDTIRTDRYRFTEYSRQNGKPFANMLYDHRADPDEDLNIVDDPKLAGRVSELERTLRANKGR